jgi:ABC-type amino acid transport substrate-binding protein
MEDFAYTSSYFDAGQRLIAPRESGLTDESALAEVNLAVELGSEGHLWVTTLARRQPGIEADPQESVAAALDAVAEGHADAAVVDHISGALALRDRPSLEFRGEPLTSEPFAAVVRIEDQRLLDALDRGLDTLRRSGELEALIARWLGPKAGAPA